ncbi:Hydroxypyruvate reductase [Marinobacter sp. ELB17]|nr:Hydroxypyruvate reductase [Marinobacter sp. ELB17]
MRSHLHTDDTAPKLGSAAFVRDISSVLARAGDALNAARAEAETAGLNVQLLGDDLEEEACELERGHALLAIAAQNEISRPLLILSGGETSVMVRGSGRGGRNVDYLLGLFSTLAGAPGIHALAIDTDGIDRSEDNAGALFGPDDWARMQMQGFDPSTYLANNDAYSFFAALDGLIVTGPTCTNVNDFRAILVQPRSA